MRRSFFLMSSRDRYTTSLASDRGQGLLEMIIAIGVITTGILSTVTLVTASLAASTESKFRLGASNLAREGVEVVRSLRDANWLAGVQGNQGFIGAGGDRIATPVFDPTTSAWTLSFGPSSVNDAAAQVGIVSSGVDQGLYLTPAAPPPPGTMDISPYHRIVALYPICRTAAGADVIPDAVENAACDVGQKEVGVDVRSTVSWTLKESTHVVTSEERLYDWR